MKNIRYLLAMCLLLSCSIAFTQKQRIKFEHLNIDKGLSNGNVLCILNDSKGFMWFGTKDGLNKYDGYNFTVYKNHEDNSNSIPDNYVNAVIEDHNGNIWAATWGGLSMLDRKLNRFTNFITDDKNSNSLSSNLVNTVLEDRDHKIWIGTDDKGLDMYDPVTNKFTHYQFTNGNRQGISGNHVANIIEDSRGYIWIATDKGLNLFDKKTQSFTHYLHDAKDNKSISTNDIYWLLEDSRNNLWVGTNGGGLNLLNRETGEFKHFKNDKRNRNSISEDIVYSLGEDKDGNIWIGTESKGISIYHPGTGNFENYGSDELDDVSLSSNSIYAIVKDKNNNMWLGSFSGGVNVMRVDMNQFAHYRHSSLPNSLSDNQVLSIFQDSKNRIWIGTANGLNQFDKNSGSFTRYLHQDGNNNSICGNYVLSIYEDSNGNIWIGTWNNGITIYNPEQNTYRHLRLEPANKNSLSSNNVWRMMEDREKNIWIATYGGGLDMYNPTTNTFTSYNYDILKPEGISSNRVTCIWQDETGNIWVGTDGGGLNMLDIRMQKFTHYVKNKTTKGISSNTINGIFADGNNALWLATSNGLCHLDLTTKQFKTFTSKDGLPDNKLFGILNDGHGYLWISTNTGLCKFHPKNNTVANFDVTDGLQSTEFRDDAYFKLSSGEMLFGGINGFNLFYPDSIKKEEYDFPLVFTNFQIFNKDVQVDNKTKDAPLTQDISSAKSITLSYDESVFSFEFASLNYAAASKMQYAYMMEGFDKDWNFIGSKNTATYTNLNPGHYTFKIKSLNSKGNWSAAVTSIEINILPPFWLTWWFQLLVILSLMAAGILFYWFRVHSIKVQKQKLQQLVAEQTMQLKQSAIEEHKARKDAEEFNQLLQKKNEELEQFVYIASHDLQEPLRTTTSFIELLKKKYQNELDENANKYFDFIVDASSRMKTLITDLLDYSRLGATKEWTQVDANLVLDNVLADLGDAIKNAQAEVLSEQLPVFTGHQVEIKQLFQNLLSNAIKFRKKEIAPRIHISASDERTHWKFAIRDNGIGIDPQYKEKIFLIFQRLHSKSEFEGSGIGLAHCKKIVELHGGSIWLDSVPGQGTTFYFTIKK